MFVLSRNVDASTRRLRNSDRELVVCLWNPALMNERIEIYRIVVDTITANEERRQRAATAYLGMIAAITTAMAAIPELPLIAPMVAILVIALIWLATVWYFRRLAQAKFAVIAEIEETLVVPAFKREWQHFKNGGNFSHLSLTYLEMVVPAVAAAGSAAYIIYWIGCHLRYLLR